MTIDATVDIDTNPRVRRLVTTLVSSRKPIPIEEKICVKLNMRELRERVRVLKYRAVEKCLSPPLHDGLRVLSILTVQSREDNQSSLTPQHRNEQGKDSPILEELTLSLELVPEALVVIGR